MKSVNRGFIIGSILSVVGFIVLGLFYLHFDQAYLDHYPQAEGRISWCNGGEASPGNLPVLGQLWAGPGSTCGPPGPA